MKTRIILVLLFAIAQITIHVPMTLTKEISYPAVTIYVNSGGYFNAKGEKLNNIKIPKGKNVRLTLVYSGDQNGGTKNVHEFGVMLEEDEIYFEHPIGPKVDGEYTAKESSIIFFSGDSEEKHKFDLYCVRSDCEGMEHLINIEIDVV